MEFLVEASKSRRGAHAARKLVIVYPRHGGKRIITSGATKARPTYSRGHAFRVPVDAGPGDVVVYASLVRGPRGRVKGFFEVYRDGSMVFRAILKRKKVRASKGDPSYAVYVERALEDLGLKDYVRRVNWGTAGGDSKRAAL